MNCWCTSDVSFTRDAPLVFEISQTWDFRVNTNEKSCCYLFFIYVYPEQLEKASSRHFNFLLPLLGNKLLISERIVVMEMAKDFNRNRTAYLCFQTSTYLWLSTAYRQPCLRGCCRVGKAMFARYCMPIPAVHIPPKSLAMWSFNTRPILRVAYLIST